MKTCVCGQLLPEHTGKGRPARFCSERCRQRAHRAGRVTNMRDVTKIERIGQPRGRAPFPWFGGKQSLAPLLASLLPPHETYIEVFGGAASLLWAKDPSSLEVYNDLDEGLVCFFRVLRSPMQAAELQRLLQLTPYSRQEYLDCRGTWKDADDPIEQARRWFVALVMSYSKTTIPHGWAYSVHSNVLPPRGYQGWLEALPLFTKRLAMVQIEHGTYSEMFARYDHPEALFYCDPPYLPETRQPSAQREYLHEMTYDQHLHLLQTIKATQGKVIVSGYDSSLYQQALAGWECIKVSTIAWSAPARKGRDRRTECIWLSPNIQRQPTLWQGVLG